jgi:hypothetical protein
MNRPINLKNTLIRSPDKGDESLLKLESKDTGLKYNYYNKNINN